MPQNNMTEIRNFKHLTDYCAEKWGDVHFMEYKTAAGVEAKTYTDLKAAADSVSLYLERQGLAGAHVALIGGASFKWVAAFMGIVNSGSVAVPLAPAETDEMNTKLIDFSDSVVFIFDEKHRPLFDRVRRDVPSVKTFISIDDTGDDEVLNISDVMADNIGIYKKEPDPDELCAIMFTSGTTGFPKGVMLTHRNFISTGVYVHDSYPTPRMLGVLPYHHAFGLTGNVTKIMVYGRTLCLCDNLQNVFADFQLYKPNGMLAVPQMIKFMMNAGFQFAKSKEGVMTEQEAFKAFFGGAFTTISSGSAPLDRDLNDRYNATGIGVYNGYGMTECAPIVSNNVGEFYKAGSVGKPIPCMQVRIDDGEIQLKGPNVMKGYYKNPEATKEAFTEDGWLKSGDVGYLDEDGYLFITGRKKNLILLDNGENVSAEFLEEKLTREGLVKECVCYGENGAIYAEIYPNKDFAAAKGITDIEGYMPTLLGKVNRKLAMHQQIRGFVLRDRPFERTASQKIKRGLPHGKINKEIVLPAGPFEERVFQATREILGIRELSMSDNVFTVGANSLNAVELAVALGVKPQTVYDFPFLTSLAQQLEKESQQDETRVPGINDLIAETEGKDEITHEVKNVLLTGATGFLGVHILKNLIDAGKTVYCLVRDEKRLTAALKYYFGDFTSERIVPVRGNIEEERLGLFPATYNKLVTEIDTVFHTAANVHHAGDYRELKRTNVTGTENVIAFCEAAGAVLEHTSTVSVHGSATVIERTEKAVFDEHILDIGQHYTDNVYIHSKYCAEEQVLLARKRGLRTNIFRIGNLTWRTTDGKFQRNAADNGFLHRLHAILKLGIYHENFEKYPMDLTAVDECANAYVKLALGGGENRIWHMFNDNFLDVRDLFDRLGRPWKFASTLEAIERMNANTDDRDLQVYMFYMLISGRSAEVKMVNGETKARLEKLGFKWSEPDRGYLTVSADGGPGRCLDFTPTALKKPVRTPHVTPIGKLTLGVLRDAVMKDEKVIDGPGCLKDMPELMREKGVSRPLLITVPFDLPGVEALKDAFPGMPVFTDIAAEPTVGDTDRALAAFIAGGCDAVVGVGGGSVLDVSKITALRAANPDRHIEDICKLDSECLPAVPLFVAPSTAGTGSERTLFAVATEEEKNKKRPFTSDSFLPDAVFLDPVLTESVPPFSTACTGIDALSHAVESYLSLFAPTFADDAEHAPEAVKLIFENLEACVKEPKNLAARAAMQRAAYLAGISFGRIGTGYVHAIAHRLGEFYHIPHGLAIASVFVPVLGHSRPNIDDKLAELAERAGIADSADGMIEAIKNLIERLGVRADAIPFREEDLYEIARKTGEEAKLVGYPRYMTDGDVRALVNDVFSKKEKEE
ncbi:MAG: iron-containing alcohol dehydrogenase [Clostridia bacterium]|nr:iron-containing alcohol dehydrogenase [Clostridia bacterium]